PSESLREVPALPHHEAEGIERIAELAFGALSLGDVADHGDTGGVAVELHVAAHGLDVECGSVPSEARGLPRILHAVTDSLLDDGAKLDRHEGGCGHSLELLRLIAEHLGERAVSEDHPVAIQEHDAFDGCIREGTKAR